MIDRQPSFAREIGQILEISRAANQESSQSPGSSRGRVVSAKAAGSACKSDQIEKSPQHIRNEYIHATKNNQTKTFKS